jgi:AAT family amino acid transporter
MGTGTRAPTRASGRTQARAAGKGHAGQKAPAFRRGLDASALTLLTIGGIMGSGLFLASGLVLRSAGLFTLVLVAVGFVAMYLEIRALAEMSVATPAPGSFLVYMAKVLGPGWTFVTGWIFWFSSVLTMSSEVTAAATFTRFWFPHVPLWTWSLAYSALVIGLNFLSVRGFGTIEGAMAAVKSLAVLLFILVGLLTAAHIFGFRVTGGGVPAISQEAILPHGFWGAAPTFLLVLFAFAGTGVIGLAAPETAKPREAIGAAVGRVAVFILIAYLGSMITILALVPTSILSATTSPFVIAGHRLPVPYAASVMNVVLLFAVLSTMNAALYSNVRVLYSLARQGDAPAGLGRLNASGQPTRAIWVSAGLLALTIVLAYVLPHKAYAYLVTATGFQAMFIWLMVLLTHLRYRPFLERHAPDRLTYRLFGYPTTSYLVVAIVITALLLSPLGRGEAVGALVGGAGIAAAVLAWLGIGRRLRRDERAPDVA